MWEMNVIEASSIGGRNINTIRYADNTVLVADSVKKLQTLASSVNVASEDKGLRINKQKTE